MILCVRDIDLLRDQPESSWQITKGGFPVYYLFPNIQMNVGPSGVTLVRVYPEGNNPHQSHSQISFYLDTRINEALLTDRGREVYGDVAERMRGFAEVIRDEDYVVAASAHAGAVSGAQEHVIFGRNEPALHHYHNTYRDALGLAPLEAVG